MQALSSGAHRVQSYMPADSLVNVIAAAILQQSSRSGGAVPAWAGLQCGRGGMGVGVPMKGPRAGLLMKQDSRPLRGLLINTRL